MWDWERKRRGTRRERGRERRMKKEEERWAIVVAHRQLIMGSTRIAIINIHSFDLNCKLWKCPTLVSKRSMAFMSFYKRL